MSVGVLETCSGRSSADDVTPERIAELTMQLASLLEGAVDDIALMNREAEVLSLNARIEAARAGDLGAAFGVVAHAMSQLSSRTANSAKELSRGSGKLIGDLRRMNELLTTETLGVRLSDLALGNIDLVDRNLYERSCDVRWWATDDSLVQALSDPSFQRLEHASRRLGVILNAYTVYFDLVLCDLHGTVVANGRPKAYPSQGSDQSQAPWFRAALATASGDEFGFQSVHRSPLVQHQRALVYSCAVREGGDAKGKPLGVLGIVFNWDGLGQVILDRIPLSAEEKRLAVACFTDPAGQVLADYPAGALGAQFELPDRGRLMNNGKNFAMVGWKGKQACVGHACSQGFETYATGWHSFVLLPEER